MESLQPLIRRLENIASTFAGQHRKDMYAAVKLLMKLDRENVIRTLGIPPAERLNEFLSPSEIIVFHGVVAGKTPTQIALEMKKSIKTISTYKSRMKDKLGFKADVEVLLYAQREGIVSASGAGQNVVPTPEVPQHGTPSSS